MTKIQALVVSAVVAIGMAGPASAGVNDPEVLIYRFPGVRDDGGGASAGIATVFHCTNFSGATEVIRFVTRGRTTEIASNVQANIVHLTNITAATHPVNPFFNDPATIRLALWGH